MTGGEEEGAPELEYTPTWTVAAVCSVIIIISLALERLLHFLGKHLKRKNQNPLFEALQKIKEELMLLGFISLLLTVFQSTISKICIPEAFNNHMLPCKKPAVEAATKHLLDFQSSFASDLLGHRGRRLLDEEASIVGHCARKGKVPLLSLEAIHQLHIFIFVLAAVHVLFSLLTMILGGAKIRQWKHWEDSIKEDKYDTEKVLSSKAKVTHVRQHTFIREHFLGSGLFPSILSWLHSFIKQFYASVTKSDYITLRLGFIMTHCRGNPKFDFHKYMIRALEADFKKVVGISWYLWIFVVIFLMLNVNGWHTYFWISFVPLTLLLAVGTKLEHVISQLARGVAEKHVAVEGDLVVEPKDDHFWFNRPRIVLYLIHFILFQNAFEIAVFVWILAAFQQMRKKKSMAKKIDEANKQYFMMLDPRETACLLFPAMVQTSFGFDSCIMGQVRFIIPRLIVGYCLLTPDTLWVVVQVLCSYSTLPLYAIVTQMGTFFKKAIFDEHVQQGLVGWVQKAKRKGGFKPAKDRNGSTQAASSGGSSMGIQLPKVGNKESMMEAGIADPSVASEGQQKSVP